MRKLSFSLVELLIVIGILGTLATLVLPVFHDTGNDAKEKVARMEMKEIQKQYQLFYSDCLNILATTGDSAENGAVTETNRYLRDIVQYGLWPLLTETHPAGQGSGIVYGSYNAETGFGRRGPYLEAEGIMTISEPSIRYAYTLENGRITVTSPGGQSAGEAVKIPVLKDPYGGYYRILCPEARAEEDGGNNLTAEYKRLRRMVLVCTGRNRRLDTTTDSFIGTDSGEYVRSINGDDLAARGDDIVIRLLPTAF